MEEAGLNNRVSRSVTLPLLAAVTATAALAQTPANPRPVANSRVIARFSIDEPKRDSRYETGPLRIMYSDGTEIVKLLRPLRASSEKETVFNEVGFSDVQLSEDRKTIGWTIKAENCCTSYSIPLSLVVFREDRVLHTFSSGQMIWGWMFALGGERVAVVCGPTHGPEMGDFRLYEVRTGKLIQEVWADQDTQRLRPNAPEWAQRLQERLHSP